MKIVCAIDGSRYSEWAGVADTVVKHASCSVLVRRG